MDGRTNQNNILLINLDTFSLSVSHIKTTFWRRSNLPKSRDDMKARQLQKEFNHFNISVSFHDLSPVYEYNI